MKTTDPDKPPKKTFSYIPILMHIPVAIVLAMVMVWPTEEYTILGMRSTWFYKPFVGMCLINSLWLVMVNQVTIALDKRIRWEEHFAKRSLYQLIFGWAVPVVASFFLAKWYFGLIGIDIMTTLYSRHMYVAVLGLPLIINFGYMLYYLFYFFGVGVEVAGKLKAGEPYPDELIFQQRGGAVKMRVDEIAYVFVR
ncbi:MAG: hypothetical protein EOO10_25385, partial [Chitinophagaceae bacterium]